MLVFPPAGPAAVRRTSSALLLLLVILAIVQVSVAQDKTDANDAAPTDAATTDDATATTASETTGTNTESTSSTETTTSSSSTSSIPVVTVPPTADAPYMQTSSTPEGAVFIAVGAVLGFFGLAVLAWRGLVAWSVNRSVRQAAMMHSSETKGLLRSRRKRSTVRSRGPSGSNMPFGKPGGGAGGGYQRHRSGSGSGSYGPPPKTSKVVPSSNSGLFFSPTAGARMSGSSRRPPVYHPSGYHAAPGGDAPQSPPYRPHHHHQTYYNNPNTYSHSRGQSGPSPPTSPILYPTGVYDTHARYPMSRPLSSDNTSNSSLNLNHASPPQGRAPSEYLEDLFDNHGQSPPRGNFGRM